VLAVSLSPRLFASFPPSGMKNLTPALTVKFYPLPRKNTLIYLWPSPPSRQKVSRRKELFIIIHRFRWRESVFKASSLSRNQKAACPSRRDREVLIAPLKFKCGRPYVHALWSRKVAWSSRVYVRDDNKRVANLHECFWCLFSLYAKVFLLSQTRAYWMPRAKDDQVDCTRMQLCEFVSYFTTIGAWKQQLWSTTWQNSHLWSGSSAYR